MVFVCGTELTVEQLPLHDSIPYSVVNERSKVVGLLAMGIKKSDVVKVYVNNTIETSRVAAGCEDKIVRFSTDDELISLLRGEDLEAIEPEKEEKETIPEVPEAPAGITSATDDEVAEMQEAIDNDDSKFVESKTTEEPKEANSSTESMTGDVEEVEAPAPAIPLTADSVCEVDMLKARLSTTEQVLQQSRACLKQAEDEKNGVYDQAVNEIEVLANEYEARLADAQAACEKLKSELIKAQAESNSPLAPFEVYTSRCRAVLNAGLKMDNPPTNLAVVSAGSVDSLVTLAQSLALLAVSGFAGHIIDFTGDTAFSIALSNIACKVKAMQFAAQGRQITNNDFADCMLDPSKDLADVIRGKCDYTSVVNTHFGNGNSHVASCGFYHDISLLTFDWASFISKVCSPEVSNGAPVIIMLPSITSFVGSYLISYLGTVAHANVVTVCAPSALCSTELHMSAIPARRCSLLALNYFKSADSEARLRGTLNTKYRIRMFKANTIFSSANPTRDEFNASVENNKRIWSEAFG